MQKDDKEGGMYVIEQIDISEESDPDFQQGIEDISELEDIRVDDDELNDLNKLLTQTKKGGAEALAVSQLAESRVEPQAKAVKRPEVIDDFFRNFLIKHKMTRSLEMFQQEWYELTQKGKIPYDELGQIPDIYLHYERMQEQIQTYKNDLEKAKIVAEKAKATYDKLRKERDFHKMHHHRVQQEKKKLNEDIEKLKAVHKQFESKYQELSNKYEAAMKEKMLLKLERDRLAVKTEGLQKNLTSLEEKLAKDAENAAGKAGEEEKGAGNGLKDKSSPLPMLMTSKKAGKMTPFPPDERVNPYINTTFETFNSKNVMLNKSYKGHMMAISGLAMHPKKSIVATASDDLTWKIWTIPTGELIMSGEGHKEWVSGVDFHPRGTHLATSSGDSTIKIWDFLNASCMHTFKDHIQPVFRVSFNDTGDFLLSACMDHSSKLFDLNVLKSRHTFRGHVDSVNHVMFQPFSNVFASASADKTVSLWDIKTGLCIQTFYGHLNSVNHVAFNLKGDLVSSVDADGILKVWDIRMVKEKSQFDCGPYAANSCAFDKSGNIIAVASDDGTVKLYGELTQKLENSLKGHEDAVQDVVFDYTSKMMISCGSDAYFRVWQY